MISDDLPSVVLSYNPNVTAFVAALRGL
ncbi:MAG: hypothetical protein HW416_1719, partial [Chloroflexi bacterium]|nr:hypothetical protein [Chloroflexota bacterium]